MEKLAWNKPYTNLSCEVGLEGYYAPLERYNTLHIIT